MTSKLVQISQARRMGEDGTARQIRLDCYLSLRETAKELGVSAATLSRWENGITQPHSADAIKWHEFLQELQAIRP